VSTDTGQIVVGGLRVAVIRKAIKNLHVGVYPPAGRVRVAAPLAVSDDAVRLAIAGKLGWIKRQRARFEAQARQSPREMVSGESHYFLGRRYRLRIVPHAGHPQVVVRGRSIMELHVASDSTTEAREQVLQRWYRRRLRELILPLLEAWQPIVGIEARAWGIRRMKTRWGTCNPTSRRITVNLELVKKPAQCVEYLVVHELAHLIAPSHNDRFIEVMDRHMPLWRMHREVLNAEPLAHDTWRY
jgi:predicted metal-dependent hydrolase